MNAQSRDDRINPCQLSGNNPKIYLADMLKKFKSRIIQCRYKLLFRRIY